MTVSTAPASASGLYANPREDWLAQYTEEIIDPARPIVDPHHHLWDRGGLRYMIEEMVSDIASGHNIVATVYVDCRSMYRAHGPEAFRPDGKAAICAGIVSHVSICCSAMAPRRCWKPRSLPATAAFAASGIPRPAMRILMSPACTQRGR